MREVLTPRQVEFLVHAANGKTKPEIAKTCFVSENTVRSTITEARDRLRARTVGQAIIRAIAYDLIVVDRTDGRIFAVARAVNS